MSDDLPITRIVRRGLQGVYFLPASILVLIALFIPAVAAEFDASGWKRYRDIIIPAHVTEGPVGIVLESDVLEHCRPDLGDVRVVSGAGAVMSGTPAVSSPQSETETFPVRTFRVVEKPGKYTDIVVDKTAKVVSRGILIKTSSKDFVRTVEVRGAHVTGESYVVKMDGLIADMSSPLPVRQLNVFYPLNNFRYLFVRILSENKPLLKIEGIECFPPQLGNPLSKPLSSRLVENRTDPSSGVTITVVDLGRHRLPPTSVSIGTQTPEFVKKAVLYGAASESPEAWEKTREEVLFRIRRNEAVSERLTIAMDPKPFRFIKLELSEGSRGTVTVDEIRTVGARRLVVFDRRPEEAYRLYYDNPEATAAGPSAAVVGEKLQSAAQAASEIQLGPERKNIAANKPQPPAKPVPETTSSSFGKWLGIAMLLMGLILLFSLMLKALSARRISRRRKPPAINSRI